MADYNGVDVTKRTIPASVALNETGARVPHTSFRGYTRQPPFRDACAWCYDERGNTEYGIPLCRTCANTFAKRVAAVERRHENRRQSSRSETRSNRHGIPLRGEEPGQCIWPKCTEPRYRHFDSKMCHEHTKGVSNIYVGYHAETLAAAQRRLDESRDKRERESAKRAAAAKEAARSQAGTVYFLRVGSYIKIGWTSDLTGRMRSYPPDSILLATQPGLRADETKLHKRFAIHRSHGREWYPLVPQILEHIDRVKAQHGEPEQVDFGAKPVTVPQPREKQYIGGPAMAHIGKNRVLRG